MSEYKPPFVLDPDGRFRDAEGYVVHLDEVLRRLNTRSDGLLSLVPEGWVLVDVTSDGDHYGPFSACIQRDGRAEFGPDNIKHGTGPTPEDAVRDAAGRVK